MNPADVPQILMTESNSDLAVAQAIALMKSYSFETNGTSVEKLVPKWLNDYQASWVRLATIEALYLGRYKVVSIEQIMTVWLRLGTPNIHFKREFERLICRKLPKHLVVSNFSWLETEESLIFDGLRENSNSDHLEYSQSSNLVTSESSSHGELDPAIPNSPKTFSDVKNILHEVEAGSALSERSTFDHNISEEEPENYFMPDYSSLLEQNSSLSLSTSDNKAQEKQEKTKALDSNYDSPYQSTTITHFHPIVDHSSFFDKLKSFAFNDS